VLQCKFWSILTRGAVVLFVLASCSGIGPSPTERVPYSTFERYLHEHQIVQVRISGDQVYATLNDGHNLVATRIPQDIAAELEQYGGGIFWRTPGFVERLALATTNVFHPDMARYVSLGRARCSRR